VIYKDLVDFRGVQEDGRKEGAPKMPGYPTMSMKTKGEKKDLLTYPTISMKTKVLKNTDGDYPTILLKTQKLLV
jgi:hypothetical protein